LYSTHLQLALQAACCYLEGAGSERCSAARISRSPTLPTQEAKMLGDWAMQLQISVLLLQLSVLLLQVSLIDFCLLKGKKRGKRNSECSLNVGTAQILQ